MKFMRFCESILLLYYLFFKQQNDSLVQTMALVRTASTDRDLWILSQPAVSCVWRHIVDLVLLGD